MCPIGVFFIPYFTFFKMNQCDKNTNNDKVSHNPAILPRGVYPLKGKCVKNESRDKR